MNKDTTPRYFFWGDATRINPLENDIYNIDARLEGPGFEGDLEDYLAEVLWATTPDGPLTVREMGREERVPFDTQEWKIALYHYDSWVDGTYLESDEYPTIAELIKFPRLMMYAKFLFRPKATPIVARDLENAVYAPEQVFLVYQDSEGQEYYQPASDVVTSDTLIDPVTEEDMEVVRVEVAPKRRERIDANNVFFEFKEQFWDSEEEGTVANIFQTKGYFPFGFDELLSVTIRDENGTRQVAFDDLLVATESLEGACAKVTRLPLFDWFAEGVSRMNGDEFSGRVWFELDD